jgi:hypothetical protein
MSEASYMASVDTYYADKYSYEKERENGNHRNKKARKPEMAKTKTEDGIGYNVTVREHKTLAGTVFELDEITRNAPYDLTEYHWARHKKGDNNAPWIIYREGKLVQTSEPGLTVPQVIEKLLELDRAAKLTARIDRT